MALPSSRRPAYAQQLLDEESKQIQKNSLKLKINKSEKIIAEIGNWYQNLTKTSKRKLTPKQFKSRVLKCCYGIDFEYEKLPLNWLDTLKEKYDFQLEEKKRKVHNDVSKKQFPEYVIDDLEDEEEEDDIDGLLLKNGSKLSFRDELEELMSGSHSEFTITGITSGTVNESSFGDSFRETRSTRRNRNSHSLSQIIDSEFAHSTPKTSVVATEKSKRLVDLTRETPPLDWLADTAKGVPRPRVLRVYSSNDMNVIFYDYNPTPAEYPREATVKNIHNIGFHWWHEEINSQRKKENDYKSRYINSEDE